MSRSGYSDDCDGWALIRWRGAVTQAIRGRRGQQLLRELAAALDAMPDKRLIAGELQAEGEYCALGALGAARGLDMGGIQPEDREAVARAFGCAKALAAEIMFENDDDCSAYWHPRWPERVGEQEARWHRMRAWVAQHLQPVAERAAPLPTWPPGA